MRLPRNGLESARCIEPCGCMVSVFGATCTFLWWHKYSVFSLLDMAPSLRTRAVCRQEARDLFFCSSCPWFDRVAFVWCCKARASEVRKDGALDFLQ